MQKWKVSNDIHQWQIRLCNSSKYIHSSSLYSNANVVIEFNWILHIDVIQTDYYAKYEQNASGH